MSNKLYYLGACVCGLLAGIINDTVFRWPWWSGALLACGLAALYGIVVGMFEERRAPKQAR